MTRAGLALAEGFAPPVELMTQKIAILARTGAGKTNTATVIAEEVLDRGQQVVVLDPKGDWWGLRSSADGASAGYPITVLGGEHGDLPLEPTAGALVADVAAEGVSLVLDLSSFTGAELRRFVTDFAERFYRAKAAHVSAVLVVLEEADEVVPQRVGSDQARMVGAIERIVKRGRFRGIGTLLVTQRSASLNKDVLTQTEVLIVQQTTSPQDRKAIDAWVENHPDQDKRAELMANVASLKKGEAFVWSPTFLETFRRVRFRLRRTFDAGRDVKVGELRAAPKVLAPVDLAALGERMRATVERAKRDDPAALRAEVARLGRELERARAAKPAPPALRDGEVKRIVAAARDAIRAAEAVGSLADRLEGAAQSLRTGADVLGQEAGPILGFLSAPASGPPTPLTEAELAAALRPHVPAREAPRRAEPEDAEDEALPVGAGGLSGTQQRALNVIAMLERRGLVASRERIAAWIPSRKPRGLHPRGGSFGVDLAELAKRGLIDGELRPTKAGRAWAQPLPMGADGAFAVITQVQRDTLGILIGCRTPLSRADLAAARGVHPRGGSFGWDLARLARMGVIEGPPYAVTRALFE